MRSGNRTTQQAIGAHETEEEVVREHRKWTGLKFAKFQTAVDNRKIEETGCEIICVARTTLTEIQETDSLHSQFFYNSQLIQNMTKNLVTASDHASLAQNKQFSI